MPNIANMSMVDFKLLYLIIYEQIENLSIVNRYSFCLVDLPEQQANQLKVMIKQLRGEVVDVPEDATIVIRPQTCFISPFSEDFV